MKKGILLIAITLLAGTLAVAQSKSGTTAHPSQSSSATPTETKGISNGPVAEYVADSSAVIGWSTHDAGKTSIKYSADPAHMDQTADVQSSNGRNHHARLQGLKADTRYYFQVLQNREPVGGVGTFVTVASGAAPVKSKATIPE